MARPDEAGVGGADRGPHEPDRRRFLLRGEREHAAARGLRGGVRGAGPLLRRRRAAAAGQAAPGAALPAAGAAGGAGTGAGPGGGPPPPPHPLTIGRGKRLNPTPPTTLNPVFS